MVKSALCWGGKLKITALCTSIHPRTELRLTSQTQLQEMSHEGNYSPIHLPDEFIKRNLKSSFPIALTENLQDEVISNYEHDTRWTRFIKTLIISQIIHSKLIPSKGAQRFKSSLMANFSCLILINGTAEHFKYQPASLILPSCCSQQTMQSELSRCSLLNDLAEFLWGWVKLQEHRH